MIKVTWLPNWHAYSVRREGRTLGLVRFGCPLPFRQVVEFK